MAWNLIKFPARKCTCIMTLGKSLDIIKEDNLPSSSGQIIQSDHFFSRFQNDFDLNGFLGQGGFGVVFEVRNKLDSCSYAIKRIDILSNDEISATRVMQEIKSMANCEHPNIVRYFQSWIERPPPGWQENEDSKLLDNDGYSDFSGEFDYSTNSDIAKEHPSKVYLYIQMQLCRIDSLKDWLRDTKKEYRFKYIGGIFDQIIDAVYYVHTKRLIHRDLKPSNIFFSQEGQIKIGDFGLATSMAGKSLVINDCHDQQEGTYFYMAPEQKKGLPYDFKVDIYSLGIILFELLVYFSTDMERVEKLKFLRDGVYPEEFIHQHRKEYILIRKMLSENPKERPDIKEIKACAPKKLENQHCVICAPIHSLNDCKRFSSMSIFQRHKIVRQYNFCQNCLVKRHKASQCSLANQCKHCDRKHHTLLHFHRRRPNLNRANKQQQSSGVLF